jgi:hypothetical protein
MNPLKKTNDLFMNVAKAISKGKAYAIHTTLRSNLKDRTQKLNCSVKES